MFQWHIKRHWNGNHILACEFFHVWRLDWIALYSLHEFCGLKQMKLGANCDFNKYKEQNYLICAVFPTSHIVHNSTCSRWILKKDILCVLFLLFHNNSNVTCLYRRIELGLQWYVMLSIMKSKYKIRWFVSTFPHIKTGHAYRGVEDTKSLS